MFHRTDKVAFLDVKDTNLEVTCRHQAFAVRSQNCLFHSPLVGERFDKPTGFCLPDSSIAVFVASQDELAVWTETGRVQLALEGQLDRIPSAQISNARREIRRR